MANEMYKNEQEFISLKGGVLSYLQRDINQLFNSKDIEADFVNFSTPGKGSDSTWVYIKVYYTWYDDEDDLFGHEADVKVAYEIDKKLFTRDPHMMTILDYNAKLNGLKHKISDIDLVKLRILYTLYFITKSIQANNLPSIISLPTKKWLVVRQKSDGTLAWDKQPDPPGGGY